MGLSDAIVRPARRLAAGGRRFVFRSLVGPLFGRTCGACGRRSVERRTGELHPGLVRDWQLTPAWVKHFNDREFLSCWACGATRRDRHLAGVLTQWIAGRCGHAFVTLAEAAGDPRFHRLDVAEINSVGNLHALIARHPRLRYSEYGSKKPAVPDENILALSYADASLDLVLTSETLEHVPDFDGALAETFRVLRPGGAHVFTVPVVTDRPDTVRRAALVDGRVVHHRPPSYHGAYDERLDDWLVFYEFGRDVNDRVADAGFAVTTHADARNPALIVFVAAKPHAAPPPAA